MTAIVHWSTQFLGLPYADLGRTIDGVDCWGIVYLVLAHHGIEVPTYEGDYASTEERAEICALINGAKLKWKEIKFARELDVVTFRRGRLESHCGVVVKPGLMLHVTDGLPSCIESYRDGYWAKRLTGIWRHAALMDREAL